MDKIGQKMGQIIDTKNISEKKVVAKILLDQNEIIPLKGHLKNVSLFSSNLCQTNSQINTRGNNGVTKYFKIPLDIRSRKKYNGTLSYQKLENPSKIFYIYSLEKEEKKEEEN